MKIEERKLSGVFEIVFQPIKDERGAFTRVLDMNEFNKYGFNFHWVQENQSTNVKKGIVRGLHFQFAPFTETKLVRAVRGTVLDVFVDLRLNSPTFGKWDSVILSEEKFNAILIPRGFAHGFCTLSDYSELIYKVDNFYSKEKEFGVIWDDPDIGIEWPVEKKDATLSIRDQNHPSFKEFVSKYQAICKL